MAMTYKWTLIITLKLYAKIMDTDTYVTRTLSFDYPDGQAPSDNLQSIVNTFATDVMRNSSVGFVPPAGDDRASLSVKYNEIFQPSSWKDVTLNEDGSYIDYAGAPFKCVDVKAETVHKINNVLREYSS